MLSQSVALLLVAGLSVVSTPFFSADPFQEPNNHSVRRTIERGGTPTPADRRNERLRDPAYDRSIYGLHGRKKAVVLRRNKIFRNPQRGELTVREALIPKKARKAFDKGIKEFYEKGRPERSVPHFKEALALYPDYDEAYVQLGIVYAMQDLFSEAVTVFLRALEAYPKNARAHTFLGNIYRDFDQEEKGLQHLRTAVKLDPQAWRAHLILSTMLRKRGNLDDALYHAQQAHVWEQDLLDIHLALYNTRLGVGDQPGALVELDEILKLFPKTEAAKSALSLRPRLAQSVAAQEN